MHFIPNGSQPSSMGEPDYFMGHVRRDPVMNPNAPSRLATGWATFDVAARTVWHTHPVGQLLVITAGSGRVGTWGGVVQEVRAGDVVWFEAGEKHWHGAGPTTGMTHLAVTEAEAPGGNVVTWLEPVTDAQFLGQD